MKTTPVDHAVHMDDNDDDTEATLAPTAFLNVKKNHLLKKKKHTATEKTSDLTKEIYSLLQQLGKNDSGTIDTSSSATSSPDASSFASSSSPSNSSSSSSSSTDSSDSDKKSKKRRKKKKKHHHQSHKKKDKRKKKGRKKEQHGKQRARHPKEVVKRYQKVLKAYKKERKLSAAYRKVGVDRNTVATNAPICELAVVAPEKYKELLFAHTPQQRLQDFAKKCLEVLMNDPNLLRDVEQQKKKGKLIPLSKKA
ncbi:coiled-coil domain-containing protein 106-like [Gouania willdenowi]|uniref:coiled-coil domain-containing protein 106-like n=1 Tax=Gouania willdenowi TaxID=441366 RepID=UPI001054614D|nr:coiled-coil domain-containing protein 106-like [Gouania willdenowi]